MLQGAPVRSGPPGIFSRKKRRESLGITTFADLPVAMP
jgi:hypothetical protein